MKVINRTSFQFVPISGKVHFPKHSMTLIVKGTFDLVAGGEVSLSKEPLLPTGDVSYPDDEAGLGASRFETDFVPFKPRADLLLAGTCYAPGGKPVPATQVTFSVGNCSKSVAVFGDRQWISSGFGRWKISDPQSFTKQELRYEHSFGGSEFFKNPIGKGHIPKKNNAAKTDLSLPNIEDPRSLITGRSDVPDPAGFGPLGRLWKHRKSKTGTYDDHWLKERWPSFPADFDWTHFNAATPDLQVEGYLKGDEELFFEHLHPVHRQYRSRLPGLRVRCFLNEQDLSQKDQHRFRDVPMHLDTLWVDMDAEKVVLVWRGGADVLSEEHTEVQQVFIASESVQESARPVSHYHPIFLGLLTQREEAGELPEIPAGAEPPASPPPESTAIPGAALLAVPVLGAGFEQESDDLLAQEQQLKAESLKPVSTEAVEAAEAEAMQAKVEALKLAALEKAGIDPAQVLPPSSEPPPMDPALEDIMESEDEGEGLTAKIDALKNALLVKAGVDPAHVPSPPSEAPPMDQALAELFEGDDEGGDLTAKIDALKLSALKKAGLNLTDLPPPNPEAEQEAAEMMKQFDLEEEEGKETEQGEPTSSGPEAAQEAADQPQEAAAREAPEQVPQGSGIPDSWTRERVQAHAEADGGFASQGLSGLNLSELRLVGKDFQGAQLTGTSFKQADLTEADFTGGNLAGADLSGATLKRAVFTEADLTGAILTQADLTGAVLNDAVLEQARLERATLDQVTAKDANFSEANLTGATLKQGSFPKADFSGAVLSEANFQGALLREASVEGAVGVQVNMAEADLTELRASEGCDFSRGSFRQARGPESMWEEANLRGADFSYTHMEGADFTSVCLEGANLQGADMKFVKFIKANLQQARLINMNLFQGSVEKADLTRADLSGANCYGVEFLGATLKDTRKKGTNLTMTKLATSPSKAS